MPSGSSPQEELVLAGQDRPQWVKSRLNSLQDKKDCGFTHGACKCFLKRIIDTEAELAKLRAEVERLKNQLRA